MDGLQIQFCTCPDQIPLSQLQDLLASAAFWVKERRPEKLQITTWKVMAIANSDPVVSVWDGEKMIGLARATSDCIYRAIIWNDSKTKSSVRINRKIRYLCVRISQNPLYRRNKNRFCQSFNSVYFLSVNFNQ
ncbi:MAG: hypothetical protein QNJ72_18830 [Pleurocapsa sp. MO_226.B13]|nr:hypothetical protein [Pleurocapsa sp. MO_226.B13]